MAATIKIGKREFTHTEKSDGGNIWKGSLHDTATGLKIPFERQAISGEEAARLAATDHVAAVGETVHNDSFGEDSPATERQHLQIVDFDSISDSLKQEISDLVKQEAWEGVFGDYRKNGSNSDAVSMKNKILDRWPEGVEVKIQSILQLKGFEPVPQ